MDVPRTAPGDHASMNCAMRVPAFAEINLSLRVLGVRAGRLSRAPDRLSVDRAARHRDDSRRLAGAGPLTCDDPACPAGDDEPRLARRPRAVWKRRRPPGAPRDCRIHLEKRILMQAGLGGGSSACARPPSACSAAGGGSIVRADERSRWPSAPTCLLSRRRHGARGSTAATCCFCFPTPRRRVVVLAIPPFGVSTEGTPSAGSIAREQAVCGGRPPEPTASSWSERPRGRRRRSSPRGRARLVRRLERAGAVTPAMSGSGSAVFGLFVHRRAAIAGPGAAGAAGRNARRMLTQDRVDLPAGLPSPEPIG